jgi:hypothetical protein
MAGGYHRFYESLGYNLIDGIRSIPNMVSTVITEVFRSIGEMISNAVSSLKSYLPGFLGGGTSPVAPKVEPQSEKHSSLAPRQSAVNVALNATFNLDGRKLSQVVTSHMASAATFSNGGGSQDRYGSYADPSATAIG